jgi:hypothetical protein
MMNNIHLIGGVQIAGGRYRHRQVARRGFLGEVIAGARTVRFRPHHPAGQQNGDREQRENQHALASAIARCAGDGE